MSHRHWVPVILLLCAAAAQAQERSREPAGNLLCSLIQGCQRVNRLVPHAVSLVKLRTVSFGGQPAPVSLGHMDGAELEDLHQEYHRFSPFGHSPPLYSLTERILASLYSRPALPGAGRFHRTKGVDLFHLAGGQFSISIETKRVELYERDQYSTLQRGVIRCSLLGVPGSDPCRYLRLDFIDSGYLFAFRWNLK